MSKKGRTWIRKESQRILYLLRKSNRKLTDFRVGGGLNRKYETQDDKNYEILKRLIKKGLVGQEKYPLRGGKNKYSWQAYYFLTNEGKKIADGIVKEVDDHKSW